MAKANFDQWEGFDGHLWKEEVNVRDFIQHNYTQYDGDESFLAGPTEATDKLWGEAAEAPERGARQRRRSRYGDRGCIRPDGIRPGIH